MALEITVPVLGESVTEATVAKWLKNVGDAVALDEPLLELETDKVTQEVPAPAAGVLSEILLDTDAEAVPGALLGRIAAGASASATDAVVGEAETAVASPSDQASAAPAPKACR